MSIRDLKLYAPETETGADQVDGGAPPGGADETTRQQDGPGSGSSRLRRQLEDGFERDRKATEAKDKTPDGRDQRSGQFTRRGRVAGGAEVDGAESTGTEEPVAQQADQAQQAAKLSPPDGFSKEAKAEWERTPPQIQTAVLKREQDMAKGVEEIKKKYADFEQVINPRMDMIRRAGHSPAAAVNQLFSWFEALNGDVIRAKQNQPLVAFPALLRSFGLDLPNLGVAAQQAAQQKADPAQAKDEQPAGDIPGPVQQYITGLEQKLEQMMGGLTQKIGSLETSWQNRSMADTNAMLEHWSKDKAYFQDVRQHMGELFRAGVVPLLPNGSPDLDKAYDMAIYAIPEVREKIQAAQQAAADKLAKEAREKELKAQKEQADKARKASGSLPLGAPGSPAAQQGKGKQKKSVRDSLQEAIEEHRQ